VEHSVTNLAGTRTVELAARTNNAAFLLAEGEGLDTGQREDLTRIRVVYGFVRQSGGAVQVESAPGRGTTVTLLFPEVGVAPSVPAPDGTGGEGPAG
jgi:hypothetical protein